MPLTNLSDVAQLPDGAIVTVRVALRALQLKRNRLGRIWAVLSVEQNGATVTVLLFPETYASVPESVLTRDALLEFGGRVSRNASDVSLVPCTELTPVTV